MTILFNITDAVGTAPNHGVTRTERRLAVNMLGQSDVRFVVVRDGRLMEADSAAVTPFLELAGDSAEPYVERFGVDPPPTTGSGSFASRARRRLGRRDRSRALPLRPVHACAEDTLVSVGLDWVHGTLDVAERHVFGTGGRFVGMCYDLIPIDHPEWLFPPDPLGFRRYIERMERVAQSIMCISEHTRRDLLRHLPSLGTERAPVVRLGADAAVSLTPAHDAFARTLFSGEPYAIYCATVDRRKNHHVLYRAMREMTNSGIRGNMVFVGRLGSGVSDLVDCLRHDRSIAGRIAHITNCDDAHLAALYRHAACAVYPSLYEGWGLGVTEALAHGTPCLVASGSSLGEAGLGVCQELPPLRTQPWVEAIAECFAQTPSLPALALPTWEAAASEILGVVAR